MMDSRTFDLLRYSLSSGAFVTLLLHIKFFWNDRGFFPHLPLFLRRGIILPKGLCRFLYITSLVCSLAIGIGPSSLTPYFSLSLFLWIILLSILEENIWCVQIAHFSVVSLALFESDTISLKIWTVFLYLFGGIQKLNYNFIIKGQGIRVFTGPFLKNLLKYSENTEIHKQLYLLWKNNGDQILKENLSYYYQVAAFMTGLMEILLGFGLLFGITQTLSSVFIILLHLGILLCVGPFGANNFQGIWAWNVMCIFITIILFFSPQEPGITKDNLFIEIIISLLEFRFLAWLSFILWGILPIMNILYGYWPDQLSFKLHSFNFSILELTLLESRKETLPESLKKVLIGDGVIDTNKVAEEYCLVPCCSCRGGVSWAQFIADRSGSGVMVSWSGSPNRYTGKRKVYRIICKPMGKPIYLGRVKAL